MALGSAASPLPGAPLERPPFERRLADAATTGSKHAFRDLLSDWRTDRLTAEEERAVDDLIGSVRSRELDAAAGQLLLEAIAPAQQQALAALLASSASETALAFLVHACADPVRGAMACTALGTVAEPGALPVLIQEAQRATDPAVLRALQSVARNIDTPKARELDGLVAARLGDR